ncbi:MAG: amino acid ABC transporter permease [Deltaproteobacteria bacterium]|jgi:polar amino acid transport system permease protein|nr:amino acid ABC transporter permease [Deltaproteobacteria bacterium]
MPNSGFEVLLSVNNLRRLAVGLGGTLEIALISVAIGLALGIFYGLLLTSKNRLVYGLCRLYLEAFRIVPVLVWLFLFFFGSAIVLGVNVEGFFVSVAVFSLWGCAEMGDLVRGTVTAIPLHQWQSAEALGLDKWQVLRFVIIPQALRKITPPAVNLVTRMVKTTPLVVFVGVTEVLRVGKQIIEFNMMKNPLASFWIYGFIFMVYFLICWPVSRFSKKLEERWAF